jgi:Tol biopolymer transport system component
VEHAAKSVVQTQEFIYTPRFSPDGRWIAYSADSQNDNLGIYVQPFPGPGLRRQIANRGRYPVWSKDGKEILYLGPKYRISSVPVSVASGELRFGAPQSLFSVRPPAGMTIGFSPLDVSRDGSRIYFAQGVEQADADVIHIKMGWGSAVTR